ncbi:DUF3347 domain-containing protein [Cesiribacter andamanensis]|uniref:DUF3347 domain-containing protein n=1 Tax=Cesiribacter andamanensis AMV16 TaxID=1279009 RepID=M7N219_9BACT|nr:DUF3347 domain-containing protein [Cesiribacter andamanensis]EMR02723.1 hypothetical protein ADICEAN_02140 [Cesiribacter andamanensis AMV16]
MKNRFFYSALALSISLAACNSGSNESTSGEAGELNTLHEQQVEPAALSREDHLKLVKAEEVETFQGVAPQVQQHISALTGQYLKLKDALVASNQEQANNAAADMLASLKAWKGDGLADAQKEFYEQRSSPMQENLQQIVQNTELSAQRNYFGRLSKHTTELVKGFGTGQGSLYYQYCPMAFDDKGGYWLSDSKEIRNPYYGDEMLTCGRVAQTL